MVVEEPLGEKAKLDQSKIPHATTKDLKPTNDLKDFTANFSIHAPNSNQQKVISNKLYKATAIVCTSCPDLSHHKVLSERTLLQLSAMETNEVSFTPQGCVVRYKRTGLCYSCACCEPVHTLQTHAMWLRHWENSLNHVVSYACDHCENTFDGIRAVAQHTKACSLAPHRSQLPAMDMQDINQNLHECPYCACRALNKRGLSRHLHRKHPQCLFDKFSGKKLKDPRWSGCEAKTLAKAVYNCLKTRGLSIRNEQDIRLVLRESFLSCKDSLAKSYRRVLALLESGKLKRELELRQDKKSRKRQRRLQAVDDNANIASTSDGPTNESNCDCLNRVRMDTEALVASLNQPDADKRLKQTCRRELHSQSPSTGTRLLDAIYKKYGKNVDGNGCTDKTREVQPRGSRNLSTLDPNQLYKLLKSKGYMNHLCNPELLNLEASLEAKRWFSGQFERPSIEDEHPIIPIDRTGSTCNIHAFIGKDEVIKHVKSFDKDTASGNDGFSAVDLKSVPTSLLVILMNMFLLAKDVPPALKVNRTTLLAKKANPGPQDWRPITVSSVVYRLFSKIITKRLIGEVHLSPHQRAFLPGIDGCGENASTIAMLIRESNAGHGPLYMCSLDLAKAFDSVSFSSIKRALMRQRVDQTSLSLIENILYGNSTIVGKTELAKITRGVRQGDPISPLLFNLVIDELFDFLKDKKRGAFYTKRNGERSRIAAVAFADDIVLLCDSQRHLEMQISTCVKFFTKRDMRINISKSSCLAIRHLPRSDVCTPLPVKIEVLNPKTGSMECLPCLGPSSELRILGTYITPMGKPDLQIGRLRELLELIQDSALERHNKIEIIRNHVVFKFRYQVVYGGVSMHDAGTADALIRKYLRLILELPNHTADAFFHLPRKLGGLGIERLEFAATCLRVKAELRLLKSEREATNESIRVAKLRDGYLYCLRNTGRLSNAEENIWLSTRDSMQLARQLKAIDAEKWYLECRQTSIKRDLAIIRSKAQGAAFHHLVKAPNEYLIEPERYNLELHKIPMIYKIRLGMLNVLSNSRFARQNEHQNTLDRCRLCRNARETPMHVLQKCHYTKRWQHERHNAIVALLYQALKDHVNGEHGSVLKEQSLEFLSSTGQNEVRLKPDLIVVCRNQTRQADGVTRVAIIDVTVAYEQSVSSLVKAYERKRIKYEPLGKLLCSSNNLEMVERLNSGETCRLEMEPRSSNIRFKVCPFVVGCRGGWTEANLKLFNYLGLSVDKVLVNRIMRTAAERSINIFRKFMSKVRARDS